MSSWELSHPQSRVTSDHCGHFSSQPDTILTHTPFHPLPHSPSPHLPTPPAPGSRKAAGPCLPPISRGPGAGVPYGLPRSQRAIFEFQISSLTSLRAPGLPPPSPRQLPDAGAPQRPCLRAPVRWAAMNRK